MTNSSYREPNIEDTANKQNDELFDEKKICWQHIKTPLKCNYTSSVASFWGLLLVARAVCTQPCVRLWCSVASN